MPESKPRQPVSTRVIAIVIAVVAVIAILATVAYFGAHRLVDADLLERELTTTISDATDGLYEVEIEEIDFSITRGSFTAYNAVIRPVSARADDLREAGDLPSTRFEISVPRIEATGVGRIALLRGRGLRARNVRLIDPEATLTTEPALAAERPAEAPDDDPSFHQYIRRQLPEIRFDQFEVVNARLLIDRPQQSPRFFDRVDSLYLSFFNVRIDSVSAAREGRVMFSDDVELYVPAQTRFSADSLYRYEIGEINGSSRTGDLSVASFAVGPTISDEAYFARAEHWTDRIRMETGPVTLSGAQFRRFMEERAIVVSLAEIERLEIDVMTDLRIPEPPVRVPTMPDEHFRRIDQYVKIDSIQVVGGRIAYNEIARDGDRPGTVRFENIFASVYNVTNDPGEMTTDTPAVIDARAQLFGEAELRAHIRYPLLTTGLTLSYQGTLGSMPAEVFNEVFEPIEGVRITDGHLDSLSFNVQASNGTATGYVRPIYRNLSIELRDKVDASRSLWDRIEGFVANVFIIPDHNVPENGEPADAGTVEHTREPHEPFFKFLWDSLRSGLFDVLGV